MEQEIQVLCSTDDLGLYFSHQIFCEAIFTAVDCSSVTGIVYNIPVELWIMDVHPQNAPMVFVRPTTSMQIRSGGYVNANGKVDVPYLRDWAHVSLN